MRKLWKQLASTLVLTSALIAAISTAQVPAPLQTQSQTPPTGIDPALLAKAYASDAASQSLVGHAYAKGEGVPQDDGLAAAWYRKAADQGLASAQEDLGMAYRDGKGVQQDDVQAVTWFRKAAGQDYPPAKVSLGSMYALGRGVPQDFGQAMAWYRKAAAQGSAGAQYGLGLLYGNGRGVPQDFAQAAAWFRKAAEKGYAQAQISLGILYENGQGVSKDYAQATVWYRKAAEQGEAQAQSYLARAQREAEEARKPRYVAVTARGVSVVPGAIVCPSHDAVSLMFDQYAAHWEDAMQDTVTNGQSRLIRGQPTPAPNLKAYGCALLPPGTPMILDTRNVVPVVTAKLPNGTTIKGVTLPAMIAGQ